MFDPSTATDDEVLARRLSQEDERRRLDAEILVTNAELEQRGTCDREFGLGTGSWVAAQRDLPVGLCRYLAKMATKLTVHLPLVLKALADGVISLEHVKVICEAANPRIVHLIAELQETLIGEAQGRTFNRWKGFVIAVAAELDQDGGYDPGRDQPGRLDWTPTIDGMLHLFGTLTVVDGVRVKTELERITDDLYRQAVRDHNATPDLPVPVRGELRSKALVEMARRSAARDLASSAPARPEVLVRLDPDSGGGEVADGTPLTPAAMRELCPGSVWRALWVDRRGVSLNLGRSQRLASPQQRVALAVRDGGCVFPGCDAPTGWCDAHHVTEWDDHGLTDLPNLALLCRHHHGVTHRHGWTMTAAGDSTFTWTTPTGLTLHSQQHGLQQHRQPDRQPQAA